MAGGAFRIRVEARWKDLLFGNTHLFVSGHDTYEGNRSLYLFFFQPVQECRVPMYGGLVTFWNATVQDPTYGPSEGRAYELGGNRHGSRCTVHRNRHPTTFRTPLMLQWGDATYQTHLQVNENYTLEVWQHKGRYDTSPKAVLSPNTYHLINTHARQF